MTARNECFFRNNVFSILSTFIWGVQIEFYTTQSIAELQFDQISLLFLFLTKNNNIFSPP